MSVSTTKFTTLSIATILGKMGSEKRNLLKSQIPTLRNMREQEYIDVVGFRCSDYGVPYAAIAIYDVNYRLKTIDHQKTELIKLTVAEKDFGRELKRTVLDIGLDALLESFVRIKLNRREKVIGSLHVSGERRIVEYFQPLKVKVQGLYIRPQTNYVLGTLRTFINVPLIEIRYIDVSKEMMDEIVDLKASNLHLIGDKYPDDRHFELKNEELGVRESENTVGNFIRFMKKLLTGAHKVDSYYEVISFTEGLTSSDELFERIAREFPNYPMTTSIQDWPFPMEFVPHQLTIWISEQLEMKVISCEGGNLAILRKRGTAGRFFF